MHARMVQQLQLDAKAMQKNYDRVMSELAESQGSHLALLQQLKDFNREHEVLRQQYNDDMQFERAKFITEQNVAMELKEKLRLSESSAMDTEVSPTQPFEPSSQPSTQPYPMIGSSDPWHAEAVKSRLNSQSPSRRWDASGKDKSFPAVPSWPLREQSVHQPLDPSAKGKALQVGLSPRELLEFGPASPKEQASVPLAVSYTHLTLPTN